MNPVRSTIAKHLTLRLPKGALLPDAILSVLHEQGVSAGWLRGSGVLEDAELRTIGASVARLGPTRRLSGCVQLVTLDGSIGRTRGAVSLGLRAVLAREGEVGLEFLAGMLDAARVVAVEVWITCLDDVVAEHGIEGTTGLTMLRSDDAEAPVRVHAERHDPTERAERPLPPAWKDAMDASAHAAPIARESPVVKPALPPKQTASLDLDTPYPEAGDVVEHFAFGRGEVLKSDGDRLHIKVDKDGRIREIALSILKATQLESSGPHRRFKLERKL